MFRHLQTGESDTSRGRSHIRDAPDESVHTFFHNHFGASPDSASVDYFAGQFEPGSVAFQLRRHWPLPPCLIQQNQMKPPTVSTSIVFSSFPLSLFAQSDC